MIEGEILESISTRSVQSNRRLTRVLSCSQQPILVFSTLPDEASRPEVLLICLRPHPRHSGGVSTAHGRSRHGTVRRNDRCAVTVIEALKIGATV